MLEFIKHWIVFI